MAFGGSDDIQADMQASALAYNLGKVSLGGSGSGAGKGPAIKYQLRDLEIQQTIGETKHPYRNACGGKYVTIRALVSIESRI